MIRLKAKGLPGENFGKHARRLINIEDWCRENLKDDEWDILNESFVSLKRPNDNSFLFSYFEFKDKEIVSLIALKFGL